MNQNKILVHFIGIGGIGMSALAEILHASGKYIVQGSNNVENSNTKRLEQQLGLRIYNGPHNSDVITCAINLVVISSSISTENVEVIKAKGLAIPIMKRGTLLANVICETKGNSIVISGAHGKTTTTGFIGYLLDQCGFNPVIINGGIMRNYGSNALCQEAKAGQENSWIVVEGDESDGTMLELPTNISVVTNIDIEHMQYYNTEENLVAAFTKFIQQTANVAFLCTDCPRVHKMYRNFIQDCVKSPLKLKIVTFGLDPKNQPHILATNVNFSTDKAKSKAGMTFDLKFNNQPESQQALKDLFIPLYGKHNIQNALASIAIALHLNISEEIIRAGLAGFLGTERRFSISGIVNGITVIDDYSHHPKEIQVTLEVSRTLLDKNNRNGNSNGKLIVIHQPHRYSRLQSVFDAYVNCWTGANVLLLLPVYSAGELPIADINSSTLAKAISKKFLQQPENNLVVKYIETFDLALEFVLEVASEGDFVLCSGAGNIGDFPAQIVRKLSV